MEKIIDFIGNNYSWFLTITIILLFALIGYIFDTKRNKTDLLKKTENEIDEESLENLIIPEGKSLAETVNISKNINPETKRVELTDETILEEPKEENINN
ncbi:MAG: hypothetical protein E7161_05245 [Firmicutes bacterium]|nr:hypothetical protein [Bacillota bacterium]